MLCWSKRQSTWGSDRNEPSYVLYSPSFSLLFSKIQHQVFSLFISPSHEGPLWLIFFSLETISSASISGELTTRVTNNYQDNVFVGNPSASAFEDVRVKSGVFVEILGDRWVCGLKLKSTGGFESWTAGRELVFGVEDWWLYSDVGYEWNKMISEVYPKNSFSGFYSDCVSGRTVYRLFPLTEITPRERTPPCSPSSARNGAASAVEGAPTELPGTSLSLSPPCFLFYSASTWRAGRGRGAPFRPRATAGGGEVSAGLPRRRRPVDGRALKPAERLQRVHIWVLGVQ